MDEPLVLVERAGVVATLTLNRPAKLNALNTALIGAATRAFADLDGDDGPKVVILRGAGRAFAAGADLREMRDFGPSQARDFITHLHGLFSTVRAIEPLVLAAVHGPALGAGCELAAACDLRIAAESAAFGMPEVRVGMPSVIEAALLVPLIGLGRAQHLVYTGDVIGADEAQRIGLVSRVVADVELESAARALALQLAGYSRVALRLQKALVRRWYYTEAFDRAVKLGIDQYAHAYEVPDPRDAIDAFLEKRIIRFDAMGR
jgi:enoyl-CoA hydratase/carnithine racemase